MHIRWGMSWHMHYAVVPTCPLIRHWPQLQEAALPSHVILLRQLHEVGCGDHNLSSLDQSHWTEFF